MSIANTQPKSKLDYLLYNNSVKVQYFFPWNQRGKHSLGLHAGFNPQSFKELSSNKPIRPMAKVHFFHRTDFINCKDAIDLGTRLSIDEKYHHAAFTFKSSS